MKRTLESNPRGDTLNKKYKKSNKLSLGGNEIPYVKRSERRILK